MTRFGSKYPIGSYVSTFQSCAKLSTIADRYAVLLMAASHFCIVNPSKASLIDLLALKARALSEINAALTKPNRAVTDAMIGAVRVKTLQCYHSI